MSEAELPKAYEPAAIEAEVNKIWLGEELFKADPQKPGDPYCIVIPPPNVTGALHLGHAINATLQDILIRQHRMAGFNTLWVPGIDHAGIATQAVVEKQLKEIENKTRHDVGREGKGGLVERIWKWKQQYGDRILAQQKRLGCSCDWSRVRFTLDEMCAKAVRETFFKLFKDGLIYRGKRLVNWDVHLQTSISDDEIYHETVKTSLWHIRYPIVDAPITGTADPLVKHVDILESGAELETFSADEDSNVHLSTDAEEATDVHAGLRPTFMTVATTRPETLLGDTAVAVHSQDPRWNWAIGKFVALPLTNRKIPIIADDILVDPKFGTGVVKVTPAHDPNDYAVWQRHQGKPDQIDLINILNPTGTLNENAGPYANMKREPARKKVVEDLTAQGLLEKEEPYETQVGHSDRSKTPVEPYLSDQWFVKMAPLAEPALEVVRDKTIKFFPERHAQQYLSWLGEKRDWPISRQLWWGHRIPVWTNKRGLESGYRETFGSRPDGSRLVEHLENLRTLDAAGRISTFMEPGLPTPQPRYICLRDENDVEVKKELEDWGWEQDPDVLDTWFSSALWPHSTLGWPEQTPDLAKWYPTSVLLTGRDIITLWVARMVMMGIYNMGQKRENVKRDQDASSSHVSRFTFQHSIPFHHVAINPTILDGRGERMSKSKGNGVDPVDIIDTHGADALRFTLTSMATETQDVRLPVKKDSQGRNTSDRFDIGRNFCNKLWNAARFALANLQSLPPLSPSPGTPGEGRGEGLSLSDRWIISRFNRTVEEANATLKIYRFDQFAKTCYDFFWRDFCDWYVEAIKPALKDPKRAPQTAQTLAQVLDGTLRLLHPMIPFITERLWWSLNAVRPDRGSASSKRLILANWPTPGPIDEKIEQTFSQLQEIIISIRNVRNEHKADPKKLVTVSLTSASLQMKQSIEQNREIIELLASCTIGQIDGPAPKAEGTIRTLAAGCEIFIEGLAKSEGDVDTTAKQCEALKQKAAILRSRLSNGSYAQKAPPHLVQQTRDELAAAEAEMAKLGCPPV